MRKIFILLLLFVCGGIFSQTVEYSGTRIFKGTVSIDNAAVFDFKGTDIDSIIVTGDSLYVYIGGIIYKAFQVEYDPIYSSSVASEISASDTNNYRTYIDDSVNIVKWTDTLSNGQIPSKYYVDTSFASVSDSLLTLTSGEGVYRNGKIFELAGNGQSVLSKDIYLKFSNSYGLYLNENFQHLGNNSAANVNIDNVTPAVRLSADGSLYMYIYNTGFHYSTKPTSTPVNDTWVPYIGYITDSLGYATLTQLSDTSQANRIQLRSDIHDSISNISFSDSIHQYEIDSSLARLSDIIPYPDLTTSTEIDGFDNGLQFNLGTVGSYMYWEDNLWQLSFDDPGEGTMSIFIDAQGHAPMRFLNLNKQENSGMRLSIDTTAYSIAHYDGSYNDMFVLHNEDSLNINTKLSISDTIKTTKGIEFPNNTFQNTAADSSWVTATSDTFKVANWGIYSSGTEILNFKYLGSSIFNFDYGTTSYFQSDNSDGFTIKSIAATNNPVYSFKQDLNTGIGRSVDDNLNVITGGVARLKVYNDSTVIEKYTKIDTIIFEDDSKIFSNKKYFKQRFSTDTTSIISVSTIYTFEPTSLNATSDYFSDVYTSSGGFSNSNDSTQILISGTYEIMASANSVTGSGPSEGYMRINAGGNASPSTNFDVGNYAYFSTTFIVDLVANDYIYLEFAGNATGDFQLSHINLIIKKID